MTAPTVTSYTGWDVFVAFTPLLLLVTLMVNPKYPVPATKSLPISALYMYFLRLLYYSADPNVTHATVVQGVLDGLTPFSTIFCAIVLLKVMTESGSLNVIQNWLMSITSDPVSQLMLIGFGFLGLIEGSCSFGTPGVLASGLLISMGFDRVDIATLCLIFDSLCVAYGAVGTPIWFGLGQLGLSDSQLITIGVRSSLMHAVAFLVMPIVGLLYVVTWQQVRSRLLIIYVSSLSMSLAQFGLAYMSYEFPTMIAAGISLAVTALVAHKLYPVHHSEDGHQDAGHAHSQLHDHDEETPREKVAQKETPNMQNKEKTAPKAGMSRTRSLDGIAVDHEPDSAHISTAMYPSERFTSVIVESHKEIALARSHSHSRQSSASTDAFAAPMHTSADKFPSTSFDSHTNLVGSVSIGVSTDSLHTDISSTSLSRVLSSFSSNNGSARQLDSFFVGTALFPATRLHHRAAIHLSRDQRLSMYPGLPHHHHLHSHEHDKHVHGSKSQKEESKAPDTYTDVPLTPLTLAKAFFPLSCVMFILLLTRINQLGLKPALNATDPKFTVPFGTLATFSLSPGLNFMVDDIFATTVSWSYQILYIPSLLPFMLVAILTMLIYRMPLKTLGPTCKDTFHRVKGTAVALIGALVFVKLFIAGSAPVLGLFLSDLVSEGWIWLSPALGCGGAFFSGSNTVSNLTFGPVQMAAANNVGQDFLTVLAAQTTGGALGNMVSFLNIVPLATFLNLGPGAESKLLKRTVLPAALYVAIVSVTAFVMLKVM